MLNTVSNRSNPAEEPRRRVWFTATAAAFAILLAGAVVSLLGSTAVAAQPPPTTEQISPKTGVTVEQLNEFRLRFDEPAELLPGSVELMDFGAQALSIGEPITGPANTVIIPVVDAAQGPQVLTWTAKSVRTGDVSSGSTTVEVGQTSNSTLDTAAATSAARGGELARTLIVVAAIALAIAGIGWWWRTRRRRSADHEDEVVPWQWVLVASGAALALGGALALVMLALSASVLAEGSPWLAAVSTSLGSWAIASLILGVLVCVAAPQLDRLRKWTAAAAIAFAVCAVILVGGAVNAATPALPEPDFEARLPIGNELQLSAGVSPSAVGLNTIAVGIAGPAKNLAPPSAKPPLLLLRPLDGAVGTMSYALTEQDDGGLAARDVLIPFPGRWRAELAGSTGVPAETQAVFDFNVQPNPRLTNG